MALFTTMALRATHGAPSPFKYLGVANDDPECYISSSIDSVVSQNAKFAVEYAHSGLVHIRSCFNNKYWVRSRMVGKSRKKGSSSRAPRPEEEEDEDVTEEPLVTKKKGKDDPPFLDIDDGNWFWSPQVKKYVNEAIRAKFTEYCTNISDASEKLKDGWWLYFKDKVRYNGANEAKVKQGFFEALQPRLLDIVYKASKKEICPTYMPPDVHARLRGRGDDPKFAARSRQSRINRGIDIESGKAPPTHCHGRRNAMQFVDEMYHEGNEDVTALDLFRSAKSKGKLPRRAELSDKKKDGLGKTVEREMPNPTFLSKKDKGIFDEYVKRAKEHRSQEEEYDPDELYYDVVGGFNKKGRVYGMGKAISHFFGRKKATDKGGYTESSTPYTPGMISSLKAKNKDLERAVAQFEASQKALEAKVDALIGDPHPHCRWGKDHNPSFDDYDPSTGGGFAGIF